MLWTRTVGMLGVSMWLVACVGMEPPPAQSEEQATGKPELQSRHTPEIGREFSATPSYERLARVQGYGNPATGELWVRAIPLRDGIDVRSFEHGTHAPEAERTPAGVGVSGEALSREAGYCEAPYAADGVANNNPNGTFEFYNEYDATGLPTDAPSFVANDCFMRLPAPMQTPAHSALFGSQGVGCARQHVGNFTGKDYSRVFMDIDVFNGALAKHGPYGPPFTSGTVVSPQGRNAPSQDLGLWDFGALPSGTQGQMSGPHLSEMWIYFMNGDSNDFTWYGYIVGEVFEACGDGDDDDCDGVADDGCGTFASGAACYSDFDCASGYCNGALVSSGFGEGGEELGDDVAGTCAAIGMRLAAGGDNSCSLSDGKITCWGDDSSGMVANAPTDDDLVRASLGNGSGCVLRADGSIGCWGDDAQGQATPPPGTDFTHVAAGGNHACARTRDSTLSCWGGNMQGQASPPLGNNFTTVDSGGAFSCGLRHNGTLTCWGSNAAGQSTPPAATVFTSFALGAAHGCALNAAGQATCWGDNNKSQASPPGGDSFSALAAGANHTCGLKLDGSLACWGDNAQGQTTAPLGNNFVELDAGTGHTCATRDDGTYECWGLNASGQLMPPPPVPTPMPRLATVSSGSSFGCAIMADSGKVKCWGNAVVNGVDEEVGRATAAADLNFGGLRATGLSSGPDSSCALFEDGSVRCWGFLPSGNVMVRPSDPVPLPQPVGGPVAKVTHGSEHVCVLRRDDAKVLCWGNNVSGKLGRGNEISPVPVGMAAPVPLGGPAQDICGGAQHTCALLQNGEVRCWGNNTLGQLGLGNTAHLGDNEPVNSVGPVAVLSTSEESTGTTVTAISCGGHNTCAVLSDNSVRCWGLNLNGTLGQGTTTDIGDNELPNTIPSVNLGGQKVDQVTTSQQVTCVLLEGGAVKCWGNNPGGCLGHVAGCGMPVTSPPATNIDFGAGRFAVELGQRTDSATLCARLDDGGVKCWNANAYNACGIQSGAQPLSPVSSVDTLTEPRRIADVVWGQSVAAPGATNCGGGAHQLCSPTSVSVDSNTDRVYVADFGNNRVLRYASYNDMQNGTDAELVFGQSDFDVVTSGVGANRMNGPVGVFVDETGALWVADSGNHRVLMFLNAADLSSNGPDADAVLGQVDLDSNAPGAGDMEMYQPGAVWLSPFSGALFVADTWNHRVLRFDAAHSVVHPNGAVADAVFGQTGFGLNMPATAANRMGYPRAITGDYVGTVWVADAGNARVLTFQLADLLSNGASAALVIGQHDFVTGTPGLFSNQLNNPSGLAYDPWSAELVVADTGNARVVRFSNLGNNTPDALPWVIGAPDLFTNDQGYNSDQLRYPVQIALDPMAAVWVADWEANRVTRYLP